MLAVYVNYPNPHFTIHAGKRPDEVMRQGKAEPRIRVVRRDSLSELLMEMETVSFGADATRNDMWLDIDLGDEDFERALVHHIRAILGQRYRPLAAAPVTG